MMHLSKFRGTCGHAGEFVLLLGPQAQDFPTGPVTFVVPFPPGGSIDVVLRAMAPKLQERMGKPVVIENRGRRRRRDRHGLCRQIPARWPHAVCRGKPVGRQPQALQDAAVRHAERSADGVALVPHALGVWWSILTCRQNRLRELVALLKAKPGEISFAHSGPGSSLHLAAELFQAMTGTRMNGVAYRGAPTGPHDVMAGHVCADVCRHGDRGRAGRRRQGARARRVSSPAILSGGERRYPAAGRDSSGGAIPLSADEARDCAEGTFNPRLFPLLWKFYERKVPLPPGLE